MSEVYLDEPKPISFVNGRNRFAWFRDHGVKVIPVRTDDFYEEVIKKRFGCDERQSLMPNSEFYIKSFLQLAKIWGQCGDTRA
jgi:hypothetical protein